jgi:hypothetical protein
MSEDGDDIGTGTLPLVVIWTVFMVALLILYFVIGALNE